MKGFECLCMLLVAADPTEGFFVGHLPHAFRPSNLCRLPAINGDTDSKGPNGDTADFDNNWRNGYVVNGYSMPHGRSYGDMLEAKTTLFHKWFGNRREFDEENEDGWGDMRKKKRPLWSRAVRAAISSVSRIFPQNEAEPGTLILVRHGESVWNANKTFTGWADPDLSERGRREVEHAARLLLEGGYEIDVVFTSRLKRAIRSVWIILQEMNSVYLPVFKSWRLQERCYGALTGLSKTETAKKLGHDLVQDWRGSLHSRPPPLKLSDAYWPGKDRKYADLSADQIPATESLMDCMQRTYPLWEQKILFELKTGKNVMVVAHANTLRGLVKLIDNIDDEDIREVAIPTGIPIVYKFDKSMNSIPPSGDKQTAFQVHMRGLFLEKPGLLQEALKREEEWKEHVPGYNPTMERNKTPMSPLERSLYKLKAERDLGEWAGQFFDPNVIQEDDGNDGNFGKPIQLIEDEVWALGMAELESGGQFDPDAPDFQESANGDEATVENEEDTSSSTVVAPLISNSPCVTNFPSASIVPGLGSVPVRRDAVVVIIRHGKTEHNKLGLFTGWEDVPLAREGIEEAREAGRLLKAHGFEFDVVYTSWLSRAIETALYVLDELDSLWLPMIKSWRLNERMYGFLTGLSKQMVKQRHGDTQFKAWRRGYSTRPPEVSSFSPHYPGNDRRYLKYLSDIRFSVRESVIRSIEKGQPSLHRKLPKAESLKDCMDRTIPFYKERIYPEALQQGKRVLISSSENAIRGLLMHLCNIPVEMITELEIPNGLPIIYDLKSKCVKLLDDGFGDPLQRYNFGKAASYLFRPCENEDGSPDEECDIRYSGIDSVVISDEDKATLEAIKRRKVHKIDLIHHCPLCETTCSFQVVFRVSPFPSKAPFKLLSSVQERADALVAPLLRSGDLDGESIDALLESMGGTNVESSASSDPRLISNSPLVRGVLMRVVKIRTAADQLPFLMYSVVSNGKIASVVFLGAYFVFLAIWLPFWLLSFVTTEWGVYILSIFAVFFVGRSIIRLIAFPGASQKVTAEIEREFARYSVRMLVSACTSLIEVASIIVSASPGNAAHASRRQLTAVYDLPLYWRRAKTYRDRVLGVYVEVLNFLYHQHPQSSHPNASDLTKYCNNRLSGDVGNLSGLTVGARTDGRELLEKSIKVLTLLDALESEAKNVLEGGIGPSTPNPVTNETCNVANQLIEALSELRDFVTSLKPEEGDEEGQETEEDLTVDAVRRKFEEQSGSALDAVKNGMASILPMLDPPPHTSVFGFDVLRGCVLSRYRGSRQLWVRRPKGGMIDVLHFPAKQAPNSPRSQKAVLYCNPNAGLIEVAAGMSLVGGNVPSAEADGLSQDSSWVDFYTQVGLDVYVFNYAGYGRSFGTTLCSSGTTVSDSLQPGFFARIIRIFKSCFLSFQPSPETLRADGVAVAQYLLGDGGISELIVHGESIGGVAASGLSRYLSNSPSYREKIVLLLCDRTFCNLEAVAQRLVGGWTGYAIRFLAPYWNTDVTGDFLAASCPKVVATDAADTIISDAASLKSGIALWKELRRGAATTKDIGWMLEEPLQYRMAGWENVCVNDSKYVAGKALLRAQAPLWPNDKHVSVEEAFHFAACCSRIANVARASRLASGQADEEVGIEFDDRVGPVPSRNLIQEAWKVIACCDGLTGAPLGIAVRRGFDSTVSWLCCGLIFGGQVVLDAMLKRQKQQGGLDGGQRDVLRSDFDCRPPGFADEETETVFHPKPIPEVVEQLAVFLQAGDASMAKLSHEFTFVLGVLQYIQARLSAAPTIESARTSRSLQVSDTSVGSFLNLHCGHNNPFSKDEREKLKMMLEQALRPRSSVASTTVN